jgi:4-amino-4-deoxy-L-arabinose transferase-like glycosyltransferase
VRTNWLPLLIAILILWLATGLRFYRLDAQSFWNDEGNSARLSERSLSLIIEGTASDIHPPLYYILLRGWREFVGESEFGLRSFSAFGGVLTVAATLAMGRLFFAQRSDPKVTSRFVLIAAFLAAVNPTLIYYSQETRMYSLLALLTAVSTLFLWRWLNAEQGNKWAIAYILSATAGLYTHYFFPAVLVLHNLIVLLWLLRTFGIFVVAPFELRQKRPLRKTIMLWVGMMALIFLLYLPWLSIFLRQAGGRPALRIPFLQFLWDSIRWLAFGETIPAGALIWPTVAMIVLLLWAWLAGRRQSILPTLGTAVPVLFMFAAGTTLPAFFKFMLTAAPFFVLWLGRSMDSPPPLQRRKWTLIFPFLLFLPLLWGTAVSLDNLYNNPTFARADYRGMAARIAAEDHANAGIILNAPNQWEVFTYYHQGAAPVYPLPKGQPDPASLEPRLAQIAADHDRLYAIFWGEDQRDPQRVVERWLDANTFKASEEWVGDVRFLVYAVPQQEAQTMDTTVSLPFGPAITLQGYSLHSDQLVPGDIAQVTLFWQTAEALDQRYKIFLHLLDQDGSLVAQHDSEPGGGLSPTTTWPSAETVVDNHGLFLPANLPPGQYKLIMGLYDISNPTTRLPIQVDGAVQDTWTLSSISIK